MTALTTGFYPPSTHLPYSSSEGTNEMRGFQSLARRVLGSLSAGLDQTSRLVGRYGSALIGISALGIGSAGVLYGLSEQRAQIEHAALTAGVVLNIFIAVVAALMIRYQRG